MLDASIMAVLAESGKYSINIKYKFSTFVFM